VPASDKGAEAFEKGEYTHHGAEAVTELTMKLISAEALRKRVDGHKRLGCFRSLQWSQQLYARLNFALKAQLPELDEPEQYTGNDGNRLDGLKNQISMHRLSPPPRRIATKLLGVCNGR